jgi:23S rRNA pseudouridine2605 synthase
MAQAGLASRRGAEVLIREGRVRVNGAVATGLGARVDPDSDRIEVDGKVASAAASLYRILLKPRACLSTLTKVSGQDGPRPTLQRYVTDLDLGWKVVAPLDFPAEGVILLTTDGAMADDFARGGGRLTMTYHLKFQGSVGDTEIGHLLRGWTFERRAIRPIAAEAIATTGKNTWVELAVREQRPRAIKACGDAIRRSVLKISRVKLGPFSFEGLKMGEYRDLSKAEVAALRRAAAGKSEPSEE